MSFAVIKTGGKQYKVAEGDKLLIEKLNQPIGAEFDFEEVLLIGRPVADVEQAFGDKSQNPLSRRDKPEGDGVNERQSRHWDAKIGTPLIEGAKVHARILDHAKGDKKIVFKYTRKTRYKKKKGHRQPYTKVEILKITA